MRKVLVIAGSVLMRMARDRKALVLMLLMPMILIGILGAALRGMLTANRINPFPVLVLNADQPARPPLPPGAPPQAAAQLPTFDFGRILAEEVLGSAAARQVIRATPAADLDQAVAAVAAGQAVAAIHIPPAFTADALAARQPQIAIYADPGHPTQAGIVTQVVQGFAEQVTAGLVAARTLGAVAQAPEGASPAATVALVAAGARDISAMQYYAAAMAIMFMLMTALSRATDLIREQQDGTLARILASPTGKGTVLAGQILGTVLLLLGQFLILVLGTRLLYGVDWGPWPGTLLLGAAFALAAAGIGSAAAGLLRDPRGADAATGVVGNLFAALSGSMFPLYAFPDLLKGVAKAIPNYWALQGFLDQMAGLGAAYLVLPLAVLVVTGLAAGALGTWRLAAR